MDNENVTCLPLAKSKQIQRIPGTRVAFRHAPPVVGDRGHELSDIRAAPRNAALGDHLETRPTTVLSDRSSRVRRGWRMRSPPVNQALPGDQA
jgi:hypothetical protein